MAGAKLGRNDVKLCRNEVCAVNGYLDGVLVCRAVPLRWGWFRVHIQGHVLRARSILEVRRLFAIHGCTSCSVVYGDAAGQDCGPVPSLEDRIDKLTRVVGVRFTTVEIDAIASLVEEGGSVAEFVRTTVRERLSRKV